MVPRRVCLPIHGIVAGVLRVKWSSACLSSLEVAGACSQCVCVFFSLKESRRGGGHTQGSRCMRWDAEGEGEEKEREREDEENEDSPPARTRAPLSFPCCHLHLSFPLLASAIWENRADSTQQATGEEGQRYHPREGLTAAEVGVVKQQTTHTSTSTSTHQPHPPHRPSPSCRRPSERDPVARSTLKSRGFSWPKRRKEEQQGDCPRITARQRKPRSTVTEDTTALPVRCVWGKWGGCLRLRRAVLPRRRLPLLLLGLAMAGGQRGVARMEERR